MSKFTLRAVMTFGLLMMLWVNAFSQNSSLSGKVVDNKGKYYLEQLLSSKEAQSQQQQIKTGSTRLVKYH